MQLRWIAALLMLFLLVGCASNDDAHAKRANSKNGQGGQESMGDSKKEKSSKEDPRALVQKMGKSLNSIVGLLSKVDSIEEARKMKPTLQVALDELKSSRRKSMEFKDISKEQQLALADEYEKVLVVANPKLNQIENLMPAEVAKELQEFLGELQEFR